MSRSCQHVKRDGAICGTSHGFQFDRCSNHRSRPCASTITPCVECGLPTSTADSLCARVSCPGYQAYCLRKRTKKAESLAARREALIAKYADRTIQDDIDDAETLLAETLARIELIRADIERLKSTLESTNLSS